jgi:putative glutamine amidotransferase
MKCPSTVIIIRARLLSDELKSMAKAPDGLIEAVYSPKHKFLWAVQWHPEFSYRVDDNSKLIFREFVKHCQEF